MTTDGDRGTHKKGAQDVDTPRQPSPHPAGLCVEHDAPPQPDNPHICTRYWLNRIHCHIQLMDTV